jgi:hypothetical protein
VFLQRLYGSISDFSPLRKLRTTFTALQNANEMARANISPRVRMEPMREHNGNDGQERDSQIAQVRPEPCGFIALLVRTQYDLSDVRLVSVQRLSDG